MRPNRLECCFFIIKAKKSDSEWREWKSAFLHYFQKTNNGKYFFYDETIGTRTIQHFRIEWLVEYSKIMTHSWSHHGKSCSFAMAGTIEAFLSTLPGVYMSVCWYHHNSARCSHERFAVQIKLKYGFDHHISTADTVCVMVLGIWLVTSCFILWIIFLLCVTFHLMWSKSKMVSGSEKFSPFSFLCLTVFCTVSSCTDGGFDLCSCFLDFSSQPKQLLTNQIWIIHWV